MSSSSSIHPDSSIQSNPFHQITNRNHSDHQPPSQDDDLREQHLQSPCKYPNLSSRNLADVPKDITMESSLDSSRSTIHSNTNFDPSIKAQTRRKGKAKVKQEDGVGLSRSTSLTTTNGFLSNEDDGEDDGGYHVDLNAMRRVKEEEEAREVREPGMDLEDKAVRVLASSTSKRKETMSQETAREWKNSNDQGQAAGQDPFGDDQQEKRDPLSFKASPTSTPHPPRQSYKEAKQKANGILGSVRGSNVSLGKKGGAQPIDGYLNLSVSRHGLIRTFALPPSSIKSISYSSLVRLMEIDIPWEQSRWAQLPLGNGKRAKKEPGKSVLRNLNPLAKNPELSIWIEHPLRSGSWKKLEHWTAEFSAKSSKADPTPPESESHSLLSVLMRDFWNERLKVSGYTHLTIRDSKDNAPPGAARLRTPSAASSTSLISKGKSLSTSSSRVTMGSEAEENVEYEPQPNGLERVGRHLSRLSVSLASLFGALDIAAERSDSRDLDPEDLGYVNIEQVSDEETDGQQSRAGLRRRIGGKIRREGTTKSSIREDNSTSNSRSANQAARPRNTALDLFISVLPAPILRFSGLSRFKSNSKKTKRRPSRSRTSNTPANGFNPVQSEMDSDVDALSLHTSAGIQSDLETDLETDLENNLDEDARELDADEISSNSSKIRIRQLFKTPLTNASQSSFNSDTEGERSSTRSLSRRKSKGKKKKKSRSESASANGFEASDTDGSGWAGGDSQRQASVLRKAAMRRNDSQVSRNENQNGGFWKALLGTRLGYEAEKRDSIDTIERGRKENLKQRKWKSPRELEAGKGGSGFKERLDIENPDQLRFSRPLPSVSSNENEGGKESISAFSKTSSPPRADSEEDDGQDAVTIATSRALSSYEALTSSAHSIIKSSSLKKKKEQQRPPLPDLNISEHGRSSASNTLQGSTSPNSVSMNGSHPSRKTIGVEDDPFMSKPQLQSQSPSTPQIRRNASLSTITPNAQDSGHASGEKKSGKSKPSAWRFKSNKESDGYASAGESASVPASPSGGSLLRLGRHRSNSSTSSLDLSNGIAKLRRSSFSKSKEKEKDDPHFKGAEVISRPQDAGMRWGGGEDGKWTSESSTRKERMDLD